MIMPHYEVNFMYKDIKVTIVKFAQTIDELIAWMNKCYTNAKIISIEEVH
jgi:hypothetical protein